MDSGVITPSSDIYTRHEAHDLISIISESVHLSLSRKAVRWKPSPCKMPPVKLLGSHLHGACYTQLLLHPWKSHSDACCICVEGGLMLFSLPTHAQQIWDPCLSMLLLQLSSVHPDSVLIPTRDKCILLLGKAPCNLVRVHAFFMYKLPSWIPCTSC